MVGRVDQNELYCALPEADVSVCLRKPTLGETSGIVMRSLACGTPVLVSDTGWFRELPDEVAYKVPSADMSGIQLADVLEDLIRDRATLRKKAMAARAYAKERSLQKSALGYAAFVEAGGCFRTAGRDAASSASRSECGRSMRSGRDARQSSVQSATRK
jgi:glycosyltransferase involved in cell wall biosynthesis